MRNEDILVMAALVAVTVGALLFLGSTFVFGATPQTNVTVGNEAPIVTNVLVEGVENATTIALSAGNTTSINCSATIIDANGHNDVTDYANATGRLFTNSSSLTAADDNNHHYTNSSCTYYGASGNQTYVECFFDVWYYANNSKNATNGDANDDAGGVWWCHINVTDFSGAEGHHNGTFEVSTLAGLQLFVNVIDWGSRAVGSNWTVNIQTVQINNTGNDPIDFRANGTHLYKTTPPLANISVDRIKVDEKDPNLDAANITALSTTMQSFLDYDGLERVDAITGRNGVNNTYWGLQIPSGNEPWFIPPGVYTGTAWILACLDNQC